MEKFLVKNPIDIICKNSPHLSWMKDRCVFLTLHGSRAYGTNIEGSDFDYKGICISPKKYHYGFEKFEQAELKEPDTVIYEMKKFFNLAAAANPSILEVLFTDEKDHIHLDDIGREILDHRDEFLSTKVRFSFGGYAFAQLARIKSHRKYALNPIEKKPNRKDFGLPEQTLIPQDQLLAANAEIEKELNKFNFDFVDGLDDAQKIEIKSIMVKMMSELKLTAEDQWMSAARTIGLSDNFIEISRKERQYNGAKKEFDQFQHWKKTRNKERYAMEEKFGFDGKHGLHLYRLLKMSHEILKTGKVIVKRPDYEILLRIRNGEVPYDELIEFADNMEKELDVLYKNCKILPKSPNMKKLDDLCIKLTEKSLSKYSGYNMKKAFNKLWK